MLPEEQELSRLEKEQAALEDQVVSAELTLETLKLAVSRFEHRYHRTIGRLYAKLDRLDAEIARAQANKDPTNPDFEATARTAEQKARQSAQEAGVIKEAANNPPTETSPELKKAYRKAAKMMHPDRATTEPERARRTRLMAQVNAAYANGDQAAIEKLILEFGQDPEAIIGDDTGARLIKTIRRIAQLRRRQKEIKTEIEAIKSTEIYQMMATLRSSKLEGKDPLADLANAIKQDISKRKKELEIVVRGETDTVINPKPSNDTVPNPSSAQSSSDVPTSSAESNSEQQPPTTSSDNGYPIPEWLKELSDKVIQNSQEKLKKAYHVGLEMAPAVASWLSYQIKDHATFRFLKEKTHPDNLTKINISLMDEYYGRCIATAKQLNVPRDESFHRETIALQYILNWLGIQTSVLSPSERQAGSVSLTGRVSDKYQYELTGDGIKNTLFLQSRITTYNMAMTFSSLHNWHFDAAGHYFKCMDLDRSRYSAYYSEIVRLLTYWLYSIRSAVNDFSRRYRITYKL